VQESLDKTRSLTFGERQNLLRYLFNGDGHIDIAFLIPSRSSSLGYLRVESFEGCSVFSVGRKIRLDLRVPSEFVLTDDERRELRQLSRGQCLHRFFDFRQAHAGKLLFLN